MEGYKDLKIMVLILLVVVTTLTGFTINEQNKLNEQYEFPTVFPEIYTIPVYKTTYHTKTVDATMYTLTGYCSCDICCGIYSNGITSTGTEVTAGRTIAVDPDVIPLGSKVVIEGLNNIYVAEDIGGAIQGNKIDVFFATHEQAWNFGRQKRKIWILEN